MAPNQRKDKAPSVAAAAAARQNWKVGDLVLAKVKGFPAWPATVCMGCIGCVNVGFGVKVAFFVASQVQVIDGYSYVHNFAFWRD
ncbi:unnamed protein product [Rhodiola kirilowii]